MIIFKKNRIEKYNFSTNEGTYFYKKSLIILRLRFTEKLKLLLK